MFALRALLPWAALAAALALLFFAGRMLVDLREQVATSQDHAAVMESALGTATAEVARMVSALATATAAPGARVAEGRTALEQILKATMDTLRNPTPDAVQALSSSYAPTAFQEVTPEIQRLGDDQLHLGGRSAYKVDVVDADALGADRVVVHTTEQWTYDELDAQDNSKRCVIEAYTVEYLLQQRESGWRIADLTLQGPSQRQDCP